MGQIERTLAKLRQRALTPATSDTPRQHSSRDYSPPAAPERAVAQPILRPDLLTHLEPLTLDRQILESNRIITGQTSDAGGSAYKMLRTRVLHRMRANGWRKLAVTSPRAHAGKTLTAINTAISLSQEPNQQVILVDLDLRNPKINYYLGFEPQFTLADCLTRDVPVEKALLKPDIPRLYVLPSYGRLDNSSELIASPQMSQVTQLLESTSSSGIVVFDLPPLLDADDMLAFAPQVDAVLFVVAQGETRRADVERSNELFKEMNVLGTVLNKSSDEAPSYY